MSRRGCLCENDTYHVDCCDDTNDKSLKPQGIGSLIGQGISNKIDVRVTRTKSTNSN